MAARLNRVHVAGLLSAMLVIAACAPVRLDYESRTHTVRQGETLYTIAWRYGIDHRTLARWNSLSNPDLIYAGQTLVVRAPEPIAAQPSQPRSAAVPDVPARVAEREPDWTWPTPGRVTASFGSADGIGSGIAVQGTTGQAIRAAASGRVVYVGTGLAGYGQLIIVKHSDTWLSAYGHTEQVIVRQGDDVGRGQRIAAMGLGPRRQPRLHFEIRRDGSPIDPLGRLPAR